MRLHKWLHEHSGNAPDYIQASHDGLLFSRKLRTPSRPSSEARMRAIRSAVSEISELSIGLSARSTTSCLHSRTAFGLLATIEAATASTVASSASAATT